MKRLSLDLLPLQLSTGIVEVEQDTALMKLLEKKLRPFRWGSLCCLVVRRLRDHT